MKTGAVSLGIIVSYLFCSTAATFVPVGPASPAWERDTYTAVNLTWTIPPWPITRPNLTIAVTGTVEDVFRAARAFNKRFSFDLDKLDINKGFPRIADVKTDSIFEWMGCPESFERSRTDCKRYSQDADYKVILTAIWDMRRLPVPEKPSLGAKQCYRVSCDKNSAIWWCNTASPPWIDPQ